MMLPPINIDINQFVEANYMAPDEVRSYSKFMLDKVADSYIKYWEKHVDSELKSTRRDYIEAVNAEYIDDFNLVFTLDGKGKSWIAIALELGKAPYDLKESFKKSPKAHNPGTDEWYMSIPFRVATAGAIAESGMFSDQMTNEVQNIAKSGEMLTNTNLPPELQQMGARAEINRMGVNYPRYEHRSGRWEGIQRTGDEGHHEYWKFRRVSEKSDDNAWIHKGFDAHKFMERALTDLNDNLDMLVNNIQDEWING